MGDRNRKTKLQNNKTQFILEQHYVIAFIHKLILKQRIHIFKNKTKGEIVVASS